MINKFFIFLIFILIVNSQPTSSSSSTTTTTETNQFYLEQGYCPTPFEYRYTNDFDTDQENGYQYVKLPNGTMSMCVKPCPSLYFTDKEWTQLMNMSLIVATISFFASLFLIVTYSPILNPNYKNRHTFGILSMSFGIFLIMFTDVYNLTKRFEVGCPDRNRYSRQNVFDGCIATGLLFQFGCVSAVFWWTYLSVDLYLQLTKKNFSRDYDKYYIIGINAFSLLITFIPMIGKTYGYGDFALGCWILNFNYALACFWIPLSLCLIFSTVVVSMILYEIYKIFKLSNQKTSLKGHIKPLLCLVSNCLEFFYVFGYSLYLATVLSDLEKNMDDYVECIFNNAYSKEGTFECTRQRLAMAPQFLFLLSLRLLGVSGIIFFGFNSKVKKIWINSIVFNNKYVGKYFTFSANTSNTPQASNQFTNSSNLFGDSLENSGIQDEKDTDEIKNKDKGIITEGGDNNNNNNNQDNDGIVLHTLNGDGSGGDGETNV